MTEIHDRIAALEAQLAELKAEVTPQVEVVSSRRDMFKKLAIGAAGVATLGTAGALSQAAPAAAAAGADTQPITVGDANSGTADSENPTRLSWNSTTIKPKVSGILLGSKVDSNAFTVADNIPVGPGPIFFLGSKYGSSFPAAVAGYSYSALEYGVYGRSSVKAGVVAQGNTAAIHLPGGKTVADTVADAHLEGDIIKTDDGDLWYCSASGTPGTLRKMSGAATAGQLHILPAPVRVYDSRTGAGPASTGDGPLGASAERTVSLANGFVAAVATPAVPAGATAALVTLTVANTTGSGFLGLFSNALAAWPGTSNINWSTAGQAIATTTVSGVDADAKVKLHSGGSVVGTDFLIDVIGYYQ